MNQKELGRRFQNGATSGNASNVRIEDYPDLDVTALIGYGHAVYATRDKTTGYVTLYEGWDGRSMSTSCQLTKLKLSSRSTPQLVDAVVDERKKRGALRRADKKARVAPEGAVAP